MTLVSRDMVARIRAQMMEVPAEDFTTDRLPDGAQPYTGRAEVYISDSPAHSVQEKGSSGGRTSIPWTARGSGSRFL